MTGRFTGTPGGCRSSMLGTPGPDVVARIAPLKTMSLRLAARLLLALALLSGAGRVVVAQDPPAPSGETEEAGPTWHAKPEDALAAARASGRPVLVVTCWKGGICHACDTWRSRVPGDEKVRTLLADFELVEWTYDGLGGEVIRWTRKHGGESDDPNVQAFVLDPLGRVRARADDRHVFAPAAFGRWLGDEAKAFEKDHPATRVSLPYARIETAKDDPQAPATCAAFQEARTARRPVLVYVGRSATPGEEPDKAARAEIKAAHRFEKGALSEKAPAKSAASWTTLRLDLSEPAHRRFAKSLGVTAAPFVLLFAPGAEKPQVLDGRTSGASLAHKLDKLVE